MSSQRPSRLEILFEDETTIAINKPARMMSVPAPGGAAAEKGRSALERLRDDGHRVEAVHRIDYETSGILLFARSRASADRLRDRFRKREVRKVYRLLVQGWPNRREGRLNFPIKDLGASAVISRDGKEAVTEFRVLRRIGSCAEVEAVIRTGRHNQIRLHFNQIGHPLVGERKFARGKDAVLKHKRCLLHAFRVELPEVGDHSELVIDAPLPPDFLQALEKAAESTGPTAPILASSKEGSPQGSGNRRRSGNRSSGGPRGKGSNPKSGRSGRRKR